MRATNLPSASSAVACTRGTPFCRMTVKAGDCAPAGEAAAAPSRAKTARPDLTSKAVVESQGESQGLAGGHRLGHIHAESAPIDPEAQIGQPAAGRRQSIGGGGAPAPAAPPPRRPATPARRPPAPPDRALAG